ncbi:MULTISPECIES: protein kinase [Acinetobacter]|uniref:protein kinase n=1 Tax=Acinetobacter TaxID=469 RepID=UPI000EA35D36|nr:MULTISPECIES: protein kinase [Acinetobacter]RKG42443.1 protein kinase [Acinetobacter cumulans]RZG58393.1 protein kinase [Acinetobacter sp. WCHAc060006]
MSNRFQRMTELDEARIIRELNKWAMGHFGSRLTWSILEDRFKFSRQAMQAKPAIKAAYDVAKQSLSKGEVTSKEVLDKTVEELKTEIESLKIQLSSFQEKEMKWKKRWQQIAYHIRQKGIQVSDVDKPVHPETVLPSHTTTEKTLKEFDKEIPFSGRI